MDWIKRNLYFVIFAATALILMGLAGFYLFTKWQLNSEVMAKLNADYATLQQLNSENPHPGSGTVDNIAEAQNQIRALREFAAKLRKSYQPINPIPYDPEGPNTNVSDRDFSAALSRTVHQLTRTAESSSVTLPPSYGFSFEAQRPRVTFAPGSPTALAVQLGDVKAICDVLMEAKVNSLDNIRRERVSKDDYTGPQTDYTDQKSVTNELAIITPYEVTFRCFSSELAAVLSGFAASPHAILVKNLNIEPGTSTNVFEPGMYPGGPFTGAMAPGMPGAPVGSEAEAFRSRYGMNRMGAEGMMAGAPGAPGVQGGGSVGRGVIGGGTMGTAGSGLTGAGVPLRGMGGEAGMPGMPGMRPTYARPPVGATYPGATAPRPGALPTVLDEKQLKVTMQLVVIKLQPETTAK